MRRPLLLLLWLLSDILLFVASYAVAYFVRVGWIFSSDLPFARFMAVVTVMALPWIAVLATTRTFSLTRSQTTLRNAAYIAYACAVGAAFVALAHYFIAAQIFSRLIVLLGMSISFVSLLVWHGIFQHIQRTVLRYGTPAYPMLVIGVTRETRALLKLLRERKSPLTPVAILDAAGVKDAEIEGVPVRGKLDKLEQVITELRITHVLQCSDVEQSINLLAVCRSRGLTYMLLPSALGIVEKDERIESLEGRSVTVVSPQRSVWNWFLR